MASIKFTLRDSEIWHELKLPYKLSLDEVRDVHELSYLIKQELDKCKSSKAQKVEIHDDNGVVAKSSNILGGFNIEYSKEKDNEAI